MEMSVSLAVVAVWFLLLAGWVAVVDWRARRRARCWFDREIRRLDDWRENRA